MQGDFWWMRDEQRWKHGRNERGIQTDRQAWEWDVTVAGAPCISGWRVGCSSWRQMFGGANVRLGEHSVRNRERWWEELQYYCKILFL